MPNHVGEYTVGQVAAMTGLSVRALHHYEDRGLLAPERGGNGYRIYSSRDIERLQHVMIFRRCGMRLADIRALLDEDSYDAAEVLNQHLQALVQQQQELEVLIETVRKTIEETKGGAIMTDDERFEGLKRTAVEANELKYGNEAREAYGDAAVDAANERLLAMGESEWNDMNDLEDRIIERLAALLRSGHPTQGEKAELAQMHRQWIKARWGKGAYTPEAHRALAQGYLHDERFVQYYDGQAGEGATALLVSAIDEHICVAG